MSLKKLYHSILIRQDQQIDKGQKKFSNDKIDDEIIRRMFQKDEREGNREIHQNQQMMKIGWKKVDDQIKMNSEVIGLEGDELNEKNGQNQKKFKQIENNQFQGKKNKLSNVLLQLQQKWIRKEQQISLYVNGLEKTVLEKNKKIQILLQQNYHLNQQNRHLNHVNNAIFNILQEINQNVKKLQQIKKISKINNINVQSNKIKNYDNAQILDQQKLKCEKKQKNQQMQKLQKHILTNMMRLIEEQFESTYCSRNSISKIQEIQDNSIIFKKKSQNVSNQSSSRQKQRDYHEKLLKNRQNQRRLEQISGQNFYYGKLRKNQKELKMAEKFSNSNDFSQSSRMNETNEQKTIKLSPLVYNKFYQSAQIINTNSEFQQKQTHLNNFALTQNQIPVNFSPKKQMNLLKNEQISSSNEYQSEKTLIFQRNSKSPSKREKTANFSHKPEQTQQRRPLNSMHHQPTINIIYSPTVSNVPISRREQSPFLISSNYELNFKSAQCNIDVSNSSIEYEQNKSNISSKMNSLKKIFIQSNGQSNVSEISEEENYSLTSSLVSVDGYRINKEQFLEKIGEDNIRESEMVENQNVENQEKSIERENNFDKNVKKTFLQNNEIECTPQSKNNFRKKQALIFVQEKQPKNHLSEEDLTTTNSKNHKSKHNSAFDRQPSNNNSSQRNCLFEKERPNSSILSVKKQLFVKPINPEMKGSLFLQTDITASTDKNFFNHEEQKEAEKFHQKYLENHNNNDVDIINKNNMKKSVNHKSTETGKNNQNLNNFTKDCKSYATQFKNDNKSNLENQNTIQMDRLRFQNEVLASYNNVLDLNSKTVSKTNKLAEKFRNENNILKKLIK